MKRSLLLAVLSIAFSFHVISAWKVFVPKDKGFVLKEGLSGSLVEIATSLGYNEEQCYRYTKFESSDIFSVFFKVFSEDIICVVCEDNVTDLTQQDVAIFLREFDTLKEFSVYDREKILQNAIKNKTLTLDYMEKVLNKTAVNNTLVSKKYGYKYNFEKGILISYASIDGLNRWSRELKEQSIERFNLYKEKAESYWGTDNKDKVIQSINIQMTAFFKKMPYGFKNEHIDEFREYDNFINFKMLTVCYYNDKITLREFKDINYGKYKYEKKMTNNGTDYFIYSTNTALCGFDKNGNLILAKSKNDM